MSVYEKQDIGALLSANSYPGRGIVVGRSENGECAVFAYFIMGRSENSRNRIFTEKDGEVTIYPFDASKVSDPSLIIYSPVRSVAGQIIVTNGDQTDTVYDYLKNGKSFEQALETREFEPDAPNFTPRISALLSVEDEFTYKMSILKSADEQGSACNRYTFSYSSVAGTGHFIHTYNCDGNPIPTFTGEPERVSIPNCIGEFTSTIWDNLDENNKISLYVRYVNLNSGESVSRMVNKNK